MQIRVFNFWGRENRSKHESTQVIKNIFGQRGPKVDAHIYRCTLDGGEELPGALPYELDLTGKESIFKTVHRRRPGPVKLLALKNGAHPRLQRGILRIKPDGTRDPIDWDSCVDNRNLAAWRASKDFREKAKSSGTSLRSLRRELRREEDDKMRQEKRLEEAAQVVRARESKKEKIRLKNREANIKLWKKRKQKLVEVEKEIRAQIAANPRSDNVKACLRGELKLNQFKQVVCHCWEQINRPKRYLKQTMIFGDTVYVDLSNGCSCTLVYKGSGWRVKSNV